MQLQRRIPALTLAITLLFTLLIACSLSLPFSVSAKTITQTVDLSSIRQSASGDGFVWNNREKTMTFTNLDLRTEDDYGMRLPSNATIILEGNSVISAKLVALAGQDSLSITGSGTLTLIGETGLKMVSPEYTSSLTLVEGKIDMEVGKIGIKSDFPEVIVGETKLNITVSNRAEGKAIDAYSVLLNNGTLRANAPIASATALSCGGCDLRIDALSPALVSPSITIAKSNGIKVGSALTSLAAAERYQNENAIQLLPTRSQKTSLLLGDQFAVWWDYLILTASLLLFAAVIVLPILYKRRKDRIKREQVAARREAAAVARREAAKAARRAKYTGSKSE